MSHITTCENAIEITDEQSLIAAASSLGLEYRAQQKQFATYAGNKKPCWAAIVDPANAKAYEVGVQKNADGSFRIEVDNWNNGHGMGEKVGKDGEKLLQAYTAKVSSHLLRKQGWRIKERWQDGCLKLTATR